MHFHAEHELFFDGRPPTRAAGLSLALTVAVLLLNAGLQSASLSMAGAGVGGLLLLFGRGQRRLEPALTWAVALVGLAVFAGLALNASAETVAGTAARILCGVIWVLWLGTRMDWASMRDLLLWLHVPAGVVTTLDMALRHGVLTRREWSQRRDAARLRLGTPQLPLTTWGPVLGGGALHAFVRLEHADESSRLRSSAASDVRGETAVQLESVELQRQGRVVLQAIDLSVLPGEWLLLCGPSGAGKSSLLRLLAGLEVPAHGSMSRFGCPMPTGGTPSAHLDGRVALLSQNPDHHFIASTVIEDIEWGLLRRGVRIREARARSEAMARDLRIDHLLERPCHALSFGEQRRVALGGLLVLQPQLLLLDEPTAGLDPVAAHELRALVEQAVGETGAACIWATHDLHFLPPQARRVVLLQSGQAVFDGPCSEGLSTPWLVRAGLAVPPEGERPC